MKGYGKELILDLHGCNPETFDRLHIEAFFKILCDTIGMEREDLHFWDDLDVPPEERETEPHLVGTSAIQFIKTSNVTIHTLPMLECVYLNVFSCKSFCSDAVENVACASFGGCVWNRVEISRI